MVLLNFSGKLTLLRVHDVETKLDPGDQIDVEVVFKLGAAPDNAFGFTLRNDRDLPPHQGDARPAAQRLDHDWTISIDAEIVMGDKNGQSKRVAHQMSGSGSSVTRP